MVKKKTKEEFILNAIKIHNNRYDYSKYEYLGTHTKSTILCKVNQKNRNWNSCYRH